MSPASSKNERVTLLFVPSALKSSTDARSYIAVIVYVFPLPVWPYLHVNSMGHIELELLVVFARANKVLCRVLHEASRVASSCCFVHQR